ncbi:hypothetical protein BX600DRAFT_56519 [Xylariales sp. PMI_506]|nr:hypothetical protein BX600DRAFT_56519 [Xylariales sp. PMI_506]
MPSQSSPPLSPSMLHEGPGQQTPKLARTACLPCRNSKRRCDRATPSCNLCLRKEIECGYPTRTQKQAQAQAQAPLSVRRGYAYSASPSIIDSAAAAVVTPNSDVSSPSGAAGPARRQPASNGSHNSLPLLSLASPPSDSAYLESATYFIAPDMFNQARLELPRVDIPVAPEVLALIGGSDELAMRGIAETYFIVIHRWLPIISYRGFFARLLNPLARQQRRAELVLVVLCMKLCCTAPPAEGIAAGQMDDLYWAAKQMHQRAETSGTLSLAVLQAGVLIALYELFQAIYPAAYLSVGACGRYGLALGLDKLSLALTGDADNPCAWSDIEEKRRVWWAILMLDRFSSLSNPTRPLCTEDPSFDAYLPVDDEDWNQGTSHPSDAVRISNGFELKMGSFARLSQATYLLSQALKSIQPTSAEKETGNITNTEQLRRTLLALVHAADNEATVRKLEFCAQSAFSLSTILMLYEHHLKHTRTEGSLIEALWSETRTALDRLFASAGSCITSHPENPLSANYIPLFIVPTFYQAALLSMKLGQCSGHIDMKGRVETFKQLLRLIEPRWRLAGVYLSILETREIITPPELRADLLYRCTPLDT